MSLKGFTRVKNPVIIFICFVSSYGGLAIVYGLLDPLFSLFYVISRV